MATGPRHGCISPVRAMVFGCQSARCRESRKPFGDGPETLLREGPHVLPWTVTHMKNKLFFVLSY